MIPCRRYFRYLVQVFIFCLLLQAGVVACAVTNDDCVEGNGKIKEQVRNVPDVEQIRVSGAFDLFIQAGEKQRLVVVADENLLPYITTKVTGKKLEISTSRSVCTANAMEVRLSVGNLDSIAADGSSDFQIKGIAEERLQLQLSGANDLNVSGQADRFDVEISGATDLDATGLKVKRAKLIVTGSAEAKVNVSDTLDVDVSGVGEIYYLGSPTVRVNDQTGMADVLPLQE